MLEFFRRNRILLASGLFLVVAAALVLRTGGARLRGDRLGDLFLDALSPLQRVTAAVGRGVADAWGGVRDLWLARRQLQMLRERIQAYERDAAHYGEVALENERLRRLLDLREQLVGELLTARVIGRDATGVSHTLMIDGGEEHGVTKGSAVLAPDGIVGQVFQTSGHAARVLLVIDHNSGVDAVVQRSRARGIVEGTVDGGLTLKFAKRTDDVQVGDLVVTSGQDGIFPKGLPIGRVTGIDKRGQGLFQAIDLAPEVDFGRLEEVVVTRGQVAVLEPPTFTPDTFIPDAVTPE